MSEFKFACPRCRQHIKSDSSASGSQIECPTCFQKIVVPHAPADGETKFILAATEASAKRPRTEIAPATAAAPPKPRWVLMGGAGLAVVVLGAGVFAAVKLGAFKLATAKDDAPATLPRTKTTSVPAPDPRWRLDLAGTAIPSTVAAGRILGREFKLERATIQNGTLALRQGPAWPPDVGVTIVLPKRPPQDYAGKEFVIAKDYAGHSPRVVLRTKNEEQQPVTRTVNGGYALKLEFEKVTDGRLPGRVYLCTADESKSVVAGSFVAEIRKPTPQPPLKQSPRPKPSSAPSP